MTEQESRYLNWQALIAEQEKSGMNQEAFCKMKEVSVAKLQYYRKKTRVTPVQPRKKFTEIKLTPVEKKSISSKDIRVVLQNGIQCYLPSDIDIQHAKKWMEALLSC